MAGAMTDAMKQRGATVSEGTAATSAATEKCIKCGAAIVADAKFCNECGASQAPAKCAKCQNDLKPDAKFCDECGTKVE
jgi:membrane protease subunit (stomatin/prohibitin family)